MPMRINIWKKVVYASLEDKCNVITETRSPVLGRACLCDVTHNSTAVTEEESAFVDAAIVKYSSRCWPQTAVGRDINTAPS